MTSTVVKRGQEVVLFCANSAPSGGIQRRPRVGKSPFGLQATVYLKRQVLGADIGGRPTLLEGEMTVTQQRRVGSRRRESDRWYTTERFDKEYAKAAPALRRLARQALTDYGFRERQQIVGRRLHDTVEGLSSHDVIELEIGGGHRLLLHVSGSELTLLRIGNHEIVRQYKRQGKLAESLRKRERIDFEQLCRVPMPSTLTQSPNSLPRYPGEVDPRWLYFLDLEQASITEEVLEHVEESLLTNELSMDVITGGPGTGKTCILLQLLERLSEHSCWSDESWSVGLAVSPALQEQIQEATDWDIAPVVALGRLALAGERAVDVLLIDDPDDLSDIDAYVDNMPNCQGHAVVVAVDPLQLRTSITDDQFTAFIDNHEANEYALSTCYRQKADVGALSTRVAEAVAQSSPFLREDKKKRFATERHLLHSTYNKLSFPNPSGYTKTYVGATQDDWTNHLDWVKRVSGRGLTWERSALIVENGIAFPDLWRIHLQLRGIKYSEKSLEESADIKGLDFAHVMVILLSSTYRAATEQFQGSGQNGYAQYRLMRIPFSRARDSLTVWVYSFDDDAE